MKNKMKPIMIVVLITTTTIITVFMTGKYTLHTWFGDMCGNELLEKIPSPNGEKVAHVFTRDCGATTSLSPQLAILNKDESLPNKSGNTFRSDIEFSVEWVNAQELKVTYGKNAETFEKDKSVKGIKIIYVER